MPNEQQRIQDLEAENERFKQALQGIAEFDTRYSYGHTDEWSESLAFSWCQQQAEAALKGESLRSYPERRG